MADNLADDDKKFPSISGEVDNLLNRYPAPGGAAPVVGSPTTTAGTSDTSAATVEIIQPGKRTQNPLGNFSSYTYQISLYMITPDAYEAFLLSGRKNINSSIDITPTENQKSRDATTSNNAPTRTGGSPPPSTSSNSSKKPGGVYLVAQSGGINNTNSKRAPGFDLDFYIDDLKIEQNIGTKEVGSVTNYTNVSFTVTEPYGFSFLTKLRQAQTALAAVTNTPKFNLVQDPARQIYMLGIKFLGYDKDGYLIDPTKIPSADGDPQGNAFGLYERYYDILLRELKFKITGKAITYNITAGNASSIIGFGSKFSTVWQDINVTADTVDNALTGGVGAAGKPGENSMAIAGAGGMVGLLSKLNYDQKKLVGQGVIIPREYTVTFIGTDSDKIKNARLVSPNDLDKRKVPTSAIDKTSQSNEKESTDTPIQSSVRTIKIAQGTSVIQAVNDIIKQSSYMEDALSAIAQTKLTPDPDTSTIATNLKNNPNTISWFNMHAEVTNLGWDTNQGDYVYRINYIIQPYSTPVVVAATARVIPQYYGPHKRYEYWFTGKNSEVIAYEQNMDYAYYNVTVGGFGVQDSAAQGGATDTASIVGQPQEQPSQGRINDAMEAQNGYMTSLFSPKDFGNAKIKILGDPDFLMQPAPSSINDLYDQFYGTDRFTINPNGGQVFIEINFKEPQDYHNDTGLLSVNQSIYFWKYPESVQKAIDKRGGGVSFMVKQVISTFAKGKFEQELSCSLNTFSDPGPDKKTQDQGREDTNQSAAETARLNRSGTGSAPTPDGTGTTTSTGFIQAPGELGRGISSITTDNIQRLTPSTVTVQTAQGPTVNDDAGP